MISSITGRASCWMLGAVILLLTAGRANAQFLGAWLPPERSLNAEVGVIYHNNSSWFCGDFQEHCEPGERDRFSELPVTEERSRTLSFYLKTEIVPWRFLGLYAEIPFHVLDYEAMSGSSLALPPLESRGIGDLRLVARTGTTLGSWAFSGGYGITFPTGEFSIDAFIVPLGQGTQNHEFFAEVGKSLYPVPGYIQGGALYRIRNSFDVELLGEKIGEVDWGDEFSVYLQGGWNFTGPWWAKLETKVFKSRRWTTTFVNVEGDFRSQWNILPAVFVEHWGAFWEIWATVPLAGRATPADPAFGLKVYYRYDAGDSQAPAGTATP